MVTSSRAVLLAVLASFAVSAAAYEDDVHYGLTKWLAFVAGMTPEHAELVAVGNKDVDGKALDAVRLVFYNACIGNDHVGSGLVQTYHFPGEKKPPRSAKERIVVANSPAARYLAKTQIDNPRPGDNGRTSVTELGMALHAYQDSFSHQGEPQIPGLVLMNCDPSLAWGHPGTRGGWSKHDADITSLDNPTAVAMAEGTYCLLCDYREKVQGAKCGRPFSAIKGTVERFVAASTKLAKWHWFSVDNPFREHFSCLFLKDINLEDGRVDWCPELKLDDFDTPGSLVVAQLNPPPAAALTAESPAAFIRALLETWFVRRDVHSLAAFYVDRQSFRNAHGLGEASDPDVLGAATQKFVAWLRRDHGSARELLVLTGGALLAESRKFGASAAWPTAKEFRPATGATLTLESGTRLVRYKSLEQAFFQPDPKIKEVFSHKVVQCKDGKGQCALAAGRLKKAPYETLLLELRKIKNQWRLVQSWPYVDH
jgi:hypothetical protein